MLVFYFLAAIAIWLGVLSLRGGLRFLSYVRREANQPPSDYLPFVSVIVPFRGIDQNLKGNVGALFEQQYPAYEIIFVTDRPDDPGLPFIEEVRAAMSDKLHFVVASDSQHSLAEPEFPADPLSAATDDNLKIVGRQITSRVIIAGDATDSGQKVHNLKKAITEIDQGTQVLVFADSDARPHQNWLRALVSPLDDLSLGAATGYRWFIPATGSLASHLRSVWNASIASALGAQADKNFCWGGSTAIRRTTFESLKVAERWRGTVSDDFTLTRVLQESGLPIHFVPACLIVSADDCSIRELLEFTTRQLKITRVYAPHLWKASLLGSAQFVLVFFGGIVLVSARLLLGLPLGIAAFMLGVIFVLGAAKSWIRLYAVRIALQNYSSPQQSTFAHLCLWPFTSALFLGNALAAVFSRRINWRGISYELKSPTEAVIIRRETDSNA
jgi:ceramide glucosyltransferase